MRLFWGELLKLARRPATLVTFGIQLAIIALVYLAVAATYHAAGTPTSPSGVAQREGIRLLLTFPTAYDGALALVTGLGGLLAMAFGGAAAGADWGWGMVKVAVARGESRTRYILAKLIGVEVYVGVGLALAFAAAVGAALLAATIAGISTAGVSDATTLGKLPEQLARGYVGMAEQAGIGFAIATIARSQLAGLGAGIAMYFVEQFATLFLADIVKYFPFHVAQSSLRLGFGGGGGGGGGVAGLVSPLDPGVALALTAAYLVAAAVVSVVVVERAEISG